MTVGPGDRFRSVTDDPRTEDLGFARVDLDRAARTGDAEVVYGAGKTPEQVVAILATLHEKHPDRAVLATRLSDEAMHAVAGIGADRRPGRPRRHARPAARGRRARSRSSAPAPPTRRSPPRRRSPRACTAPGCTRSTTSAWPGCTGCSASATELERPTAWSSWPAWRARCPSVVGGLDRRTAGRGADQRRVRRVVRRAGRAAGDAQLLRARRDRGQHRQRVRRGGVRRPGRPAGRGAQDAMTIWIDASAGASGDMLLGALVGAGVPVDVLQRAVDAIAPEPVKLRVEQVTRNGFAATRCQVEVADSVHHRTWRDIEALLGDADLDEPGRAPRAARLRAARRRRGPRPRPATRRRPLPRGRRPGRDRRHRRRERRLRPPRSRPRSSVSPVAVGSGHVRGAHGTLPVPPPAVAELLRGVPSYAGPPGAPAMELCTPTGAALLTTVATSWGPQPAMTTDRDRRSAPAAATREGHANVCGSSSQATGDAACRRPRPLLHRDQHRRPRPPGLAVGDRRPARRRRQRRLADPDPDEEGPARPHPQRPGRRRPGRRRCATTIFRQTSTIGLREQRARQARPRARDGRGRGRRPADRGQARAGTTAYSSTRSPSTTTSPAPAAALGRPVSDVLAAAIAATHTLPGGRR